MKHLISLTIICVISIISLQAQDHEHEHHHSHSRNEIGISGGAIYCLDHNSWGGGVHTHYFRTLGMHSKWSLGGSVEQAWTDENHFTISAGAKYQIIDKLSLGVLPGITFFSHDKHNEHDGHDHDHDHDHSDKKSAFSLHFELVYDLFHWEKFHLGPALDYSWSKNDSHFMMGIHAAFCF